MKILLKSLAILTVAALSFAPTFARAQDDSGGGGTVSFQTFYDQLGNQGTWVQTDDYGYVFQPNITDSDWQPYSNGYWVETDEGFTWVSDEPWGWATYHYGRWANIDGMGWVWVPGYRWAPAWVSWRYGGGYCGWAPLPPETLYGAEYDEPRTRVGFGFHFGGDVDVSFHIGPGCYNFVRVEDMGERDYRHHIVNRYNNYTIINQTTNITNINVTNNNFNNNDGGSRRFNGVAAGGPPVNEVNAHARERIPTVQLAASNQAGKSNLQGNTLAVFAPTVDPNSLNQARPGTVSQTLNHPRFNRGDSISKPLTVTRNVQAPPPSPEAIHAAEQAQASVPATAKIATPKTQMKTTPSQPITALAPVIRSNPVNPTNPNNPGTPGFNQGNPNRERHANNPGGAVNTPGNQPGEIKSPTFNQQPQGQPRTESVNPAPAAPAANTLTPPPQVNTPPANPNVINDNNFPQRSHHEKQDNNGNQPPNTFHPQTRIDAQNQGNPNVINDNNFPQRSHHEKQDNNGNQPPNTFHPQTRIDAQNQGNPNVINDNNFPQRSHHEKQDNNGNQPPNTFHPQTRIDTQNQGNPNVIHNENNPPQNFHRENQDNGGNQHPSFTPPPPQNFHRENQNNGENQPSPRVAPTQIAPPVHMENPGNNGGFHPQNQNGGGQGQGGNHPSGGDGKKEKDDKKP
jgi:hypothetical protein